MLLQCTLQQFTGTCSHRFAHTKEFRSTGHTRATKGLRVSGRRLTAASGKVIYEVKLGLHRLHMGYTGL